MTPVVVVGFLFVGFVVILPVKLKSLTNTLEMLLPPGTEEFSIKVIDI